MSIRATIWLQVGRTSFFALLVVALFAGCQSYSRPGSRGWRAAPGQAPAVKPVVAVTAFENKAGFSGQWNLGEGVADMLITRLMDSDRVVVLERQHLDDVVGEIVRQGQDMFRKEGRVEQGRLKNAQFLIRGVVTDFTVTGDSSGWFSTANVAVRGRASRARVAINLRVSDVASGEVITSVKADGEVSSGGFGAQVNYKNVTLGGDTFLRTPLGRATEKAISRAVKQIIHDLPLLYWQPRIAESGPDSVIINGGANVNLRIGDQFAVREPGRDITDPVTGNVIENAPGRITGKVEIRKVNPESAHAILLNGKAERGDHLEIIKKP